MSASICSTDEFVYELARKLARVGPNSATAKRLYLQADSHGLLDDLALALRATTEWHISAAIEHARATRRQHLRLVK